MVQRMRGAVILLSSSMHFTSGIHPHINKPQIIPTNNLSTSGLDSLDKNMCQLFHNLLNKSTSVKDNSQVMACLDFNKQLAHKLVLPSLQCRTDSTIPIGITTLDLTAPS